nr:T-cell receptor gamma chain [Vicugna pacos]
MLSLFPLLTLAILGAYSVYGAGHLEQPQLSSTKQLSKTARLECVVSGVTISTTSVYWYRERPGQAVQHLLHVSADNTVSVELGIRPGKFEADKTPDTSTSTLTIHSVGEQDAATYYCALWAAADGRTIKVFGSGTRLIVTDRKLDADMAPKPTIFFPSIAEINLDKAGTHLCLLENFFPDAIKVHWKAKDSNTVLESQQGNTIMTNDTYMKFSWLTVPEKSMDTEHICVVKHENNKGGIDQEIHFPPINQEDSTKPCLKKESDTVRLQRASTSAYYAYLLLLLKSGLYLCVVAFLLLRRTAVCGHGKGS